MGSSKRKSDIKVGKKAEIKLKESEVNYKILNNELETILDLNPGLLFCKDINDVITRVNQNFADLLNSKKEDIIGKTTFDLFPKDQAEAFRKDDLDVINTGKPKLNIEEVADFPDKKMWTTTSKVPYYNEKGEINGIIGLAIDITERKIAEQKLEVSEKQLRELNDNLEMKVLARTEALKISEQKYKTILDGIATGVWVADKDNNIYYANKGMAKIAGIPPEQLVNANVLKDFSESTLKYFRPYYLKARNTLKSVFYDSVPVITPAGRQSFQSGWLIPLTKDGKFHDTICTVEDITERKKTEQNLKESEKKLRNLNIKLEQKVEERTKKLQESEKNYRALLQNMREGYYALDLKGNFTFANEYFCKTVGYSKEEIIGKSYRLIYDEKSSKKMFKMFNQLYRSGIPLPHTNRAEGLTNRGKQVFFEGIIDLIYDSEGNKTGFYGFARDITEKKKAEEKLKKSEEILRSTLESSAEGILVVDENGHVTHTNSKFADMWRIPQDLIAEKDDQKLIDCVLSQLTDPKAFISKVKQLYISASESFDTLFFKDARVFERFSSPLIHAGEIKGRVWSFRDVTKQKISEQNLKESEQRLKSFMNSATDGFLLFDAKLNYIDVNNVSSEIIGMTIEEIIGKNILDIAPNLKETGRYDKFLDVIKTGEPFSTEDAIFNRIDGSLSSNLSIRAFKVGDNLGIIFTDITEIKKVELKLRETNVELSVLNKIITLGNESTSLQEFLENSYDQVLEVVNFDRGGIYLYDPKTHHNKLVLHKNIHPDFFAAVEDIDMLVQPFYTVFDKTNPYYIEDFSEFMEGSKDLGIYSAIIVPLRSKDEYIGSLNIASDEYQILSQKDLEILVAIGKQMGIIIQKFESEKLLKESEQRLKSFKNSATDGFVLYDARLNYIDVNNIASQIIGMNREEIIGKNILDVVPNLKETGRYDKYLDVIKTGEPFSTEEGIINRRDGHSSSQLSIRAFKVGDNLGMILTDITERKKSEEVLKESEQKLKEAQALGKIGYWEFDINSQQITWSDQVFEIYHRDPSLGPPSVEEEENFYTPEINERLKKYASRAIEFGEEFDYDFHVNLPNGMVVQLTSLMRALKNRSGQVIKLVGTVQDITERKEKEKEIFDLAKFPSENPYPVLRVNRDELMYINESGQKLFNIGDSSQIPNIIKENAKYSFESNQINKAEIEINGRIYSFTFTPIKDNDYVTIYGMDITERKQVEVKLRELNKLKTEFLRRASHELKTPLITIKGFSELILSVHEDQLDPSINAKLREINAGCERLQNIIESLLKTSRLESPELKPSKYREDLSFLINFCVLELESMAERRRHSIILDVHDPLPVTIEKEEIHDVLSNLLSNAIKYTPPMGKIYIRTELKEGFVIVSVRDNGIGFTDEQKELIFKQFGKIERYGQGLDIGIDGTGLGLYISKKIVESHGGKIWMESEGKYKGSTFYFSLPKIIE